MYFCKVNYYILLSSNHLGYFFFWKKYSSLFSKYLGCWTAGYAMLLLSFVFTSAMLRSLRHTNVTGSSGTYSALQKIRFWVICIQDIHRVSWCAGHNFAGQKVVLLQIFRCSTAAKIWLWKWVLDIASYNYSATNLALLNVLEWQYVLPFVHATTCI